MQILTTAQQRELDAHTMAHEPIGSFELMRRAAGELWLRLMAEGRMDAVLVVCGPGNNGGDGLLMADRLADCGLEVRVWHVQVGTPGADNLRALAALKERGKVQVTELADEALMHQPKENVLVVDALFGTGLSRPLTGLAAAVVRTLNTWPNRIVSIDLPSGMMGEDNSTNDMTAIVRADLTLAIHSPKLAMLLPDAGALAGRWDVVKIGLMEGTSGIVSPFRTIEATELKGLLPPRPRFGHKGTFGHALTLSGSEGKMGAARLCARAALRSGAGLVTAYVPRCGRDVMQMGEPEVMCLMAPGESGLSGLPDLSAYTAVACGPGIGMGQEAAGMLKLLLQECRVPMVLDADALNLLGENRTWLHFLPRGTVLTPHPKEFDRMFGAHSSAYGRLMTQREQAIRLGVVIVLKGAHTSVALPDGTVHFNTTGNPGMATAGSGDVLTGITAGLLAQGLNSGAAALLAVHVHGMAGDMALETESEQSLTAGDIIGHLGRAFRTLSESRVSD